MSFARKIARNAMREARKQAEVDAAAGVLVPGEQACREAASNVARMLGEPIVITIGPVTALMLTAGDVAQVDRIFHEQGHAVQKTVAAIEDSPELVVAFGYGRMGGQIATFTKYGSWMTDEQRDFVQREVRLVA